jgi:hypothetical protein
MSESTNEFEKARRRRGIETGAYTRLMHGQRFANKARAAKRPGKGNRTNWRKGL